LDIQNLGEIFIMYTKANSSFLLKTCLVAGASLMSSSLLYAYETPGRITHPMKMSQDRGGACWFFGKSVSDPLCPAEAPAKPVAAATIQASPMSLDTGGLFEIGSHDLRAESKEKVVELAQKIKSEKPNARELSITGYADPSGPSSLNQQLSELRAERVKDVLIQEGVRSTSIRSTGRGAANAVVTLDDCDGKTGADLSSCLAPNRRIEVNVL
jgi:outer membrane protein OmpA-like peptidoglycan-associated protein